MSNDIIYILEKKLILNSDPKNNLSFNQISISLADHRYIIIYSLDIIFQYEIIKIKIDHSQRITINQFASSSKYKSV